MNVSITINGEQVSREIEPRQLLIHFIRDTPGLTGTHWGCDTSNCGACVVLMDGQAIKSCTVLAAMCEAERIRQVMTRYTTETAVWTARLTGDDGVPRANLLADPAGTGDGFARGGQVDRPEFGCFGRTGMGDANQVDQGIAAGHAVAVA